MLLKYARMTEHILILNDHGIDADEADLKTTFTLLNLRDVRERYGLRFNITIEMRKELSQKIVGDGEKTDFLVDTSMSSLILAQAAENPELIDVFREILSNTGNELYLKRAGAMKLAGSRSVRELRRELLRRGYVYLGRSDPENGSTFDKMLDEIVTLGEEDNLIVLGAE